MSFHHKIVMQERAVEVGNHEWFASILPFSLVCILRVICDNNIVALLSRIESIYCIGCVYATVYNAKHQITHTEFMNEMWSNEEWDDIDDDKYMSAMRNVVIEQYNNILPSRGDVGMHNAHADNA